MRISRSAALRRQPAQRQIFRDLAQQVVRPPISHHQLDCLVLVVGKCGFPSVPERPVAPNRSHVGHQPLLRQALPNVLVAEVQRA